ncbi:MAG: RDD family protein [Acidimicrobiales bacterium]
MAPLGRRLSARTLDTLVNLILFVIPFFFLSSDRVLARLLVGGLVVAAVEAAFVSSMGATPGKLIAGIRVLALDEAMVGPGPAARRGLVIGFCTVLVCTPPVLTFDALADSPVGGPAAFVVTLFSLALAAVFVATVLGSPLRRGVPDRIAGTFVVHRDAPVRIATADLAELTTAGRPPALTRWGLVATFDQRRRARASRLDNAPVLVLAILAVAFAGSVDGVSGGTLLGLAAVWFVLFVADETWRVSRYGGTGGHRRAGLAVVDVDTGEAPAPGRSLARAVLVALPLYVLPGAVLATLSLSGDDGSYALVTVVLAVLLLVWLIWARSAREGRTLHDLVGRTVVVVAPLRRREE